MGRSEFDWQPGAARKQSGWGPENCDGGWGEAALGRGYLTQGLTGQRFYSSVKLKAVKSLQTDKKHGSGSHFSKEHSGSHRDVAQSGGVRPVWRLLFLSAC